MVIRTTSQAGVRWKRYLGQKVNALPRGGRYRRFIEGFILEGSNIKGKKKGVVLDLPTSMLVSDSVYDQVGQSLVDPLVTIAPSRDLFNPDAKSSTDPLKEFTFKKMEAAASLAPEFFFTTVPPGDGTRYTTARSNNGYTGTGAYRGGYIFNLTPDPLQLWPFDSPTPLWARWEAKFVSPKSLVRIGLQEDLLYLDSGGYYFYARATDRDYYPDSVPIPSCDRRVLSDGTDIMAMAIPVVRDTGAYDEGTNNANYGYGGIYILRVLITSEAGKPVDVQVIDSWVVGSEFIATGPLSAVGWEIEERGRFGIMPNRLEGDITIAEDGSVFWGGIWETSRERDTFIGYTGVRSLVSITIPLNGSPNLTKLYTTVVTNQGDDSAYGYLSMDDDPLSDVFPYVNNVQCYSPPGMAPFFVAEAVYFDRDSISANGADVAASNSSALVIGDASTVRFRTIPDGAFQPPGATMGIRGENVISAARTVLADANKQHPKIGFPIRMESSYQTVKWMEIDLSDDSFTMRGVMGTAGTSWDVQPTVTCYQRMESVTEALINEEVRPAGYLLTYGVDGVGYTKLSRDSGETWQDIAKFASRSAAYYFGSGFFGTALDQMYYPVSDDG